MTTYMTTQVLVAGPDGLLVERKVVEVSVRPAADSGERPRKRAAYYRVQSTDTPNRKQVSREEGLISGCVWVYARCAQRRLRDD
jgi:endonuclease YncB( thermonuclease family)